MEISDIKTRLTLAQVLHHYNQKPKNKMLKCPWHEDRTASLQVNLEKNYYKCHACGKKGDQIQWIEDYEKISKHEAINKAKSLMRSEQIAVNNQQPSKPKMTESERIFFLERMFNSFKKGIYNSPPAKEYLQSRGLDYHKLNSPLLWGGVGGGVGFNGGQFHHGERKSQELINKCLEVGLLIDKGLTSKTGDKTYGVFANKCLIFPLRNKTGNIVSIYGRSILNTTSPSPSGRAGEGFSKHFYLKNRQGLYPNYPNPNTKKLILTESIIDAASLLPTLEKAPFGGWGIIACFGTNGLNEEILNAIKELKQLEEIIFCF